MNTPTQNLFETYPDVPWKQGWLLSSGPEQTDPLLTTGHPGALAPADNSWMLTLMPSSIPCTVRLFSNALSIHARKQRSGRFLEAVLTEPGVLIGKSKNLPMPSLSAEEAVEEETGLFWLKRDGQNVLLQHKDSFFVLVWGNHPKELMRVKAEEALEIDFEELVQQETQRRAHTAHLFSINPRHNPPVALAAESLRQRLRNRTAALHGLWSTADGFETETFSLNELTPLLRAWLLVDPDTALQLMQTTLSLQQDAGGFPAWVNDQGVLSTAAPWPQIIHCFELVWQESRDPVLLKKTLPALRKYMQWALRHFDPHRDQIPAWQSEQEVFIPNSFERNKATPALTVMLLNEFDALLRLCTESEAATAAIESLAEERDQLIHTLTTIFWVPETRSFSNAWKDGHYIHEPTLESFLPLLWKDLPEKYKAPLLEKFEETQEFPGEEAPRKTVDDTSHLPAIHQFIAFEALRCGDENRALIMRFVRRAREGFSTWFERESIEAARKLDHNDMTPRKAYALGPVTASLVLTTQQEFQYEASAHSSFIKEVQRWTHRHRFNRTDLGIVIVFIIACGITHRLYHAPGKQNTEALMAEAVLNYSQGHFTKAMEIFRRVPDDPLSCLLQANLIMLTENTELAEELYHKTLLKTPASPSALFGYALSLQTNEKFDLAIRRYNDFIDIYEGSIDQRIIDTAYKFMRLAEEEFSHPPKWKQVYNYSIMNDLGL